MSLIDEAKALAEKRELEAAAQARHDIDRAAYRAKRLDELKALVLPELQPLDGVQGKYGILRVRIRETDETFARISCGSKDIARFEAELVNTTWSPSDDCRDQPFHDERVTAVFLTPSSHQKSFSISDKAKLLEFLKQLTQAVSEWL